mmetsp:Transcript_20048/g.40878  ORF Transcript_20048/g.40878 Transcript_20048/m.40878 type:complete len:214 (+) Transcript_20048:741-1382(+)
MRAMSGRGAGPNLASSATALTTSTTPPRARSSWPTRRVRRPSECAGWAGSAACTSPAGNSTARRSAAMAPSSPGVLAATAGWATGTRQTCTSPSLSRSAAARRWHVARCTRPSWASPRCARACSRWARRRSSSCAAASRAPRRTRGCTPRSRTSCAAGRCTTWAWGRCTRRCTPTTARSRGARALPRASSAWESRARSPPPTPPRCQASTAWP